MNTSSFPYFKHMLFAVALVSGIFIISSRFARAVSPSIVISEIQVGGASANDEFVELYNPTNTTVDITGWRLSRKASSADSSLTTLVSSITGSIQPYSYFLIANPTFSHASITPDLYYSATTSGIAANNTVILFSDNGLTVIDKAGMGTAEDVETAATVVPENGKSIERKAHALATSDSMQTGSDTNTGNGYDSDNNSTDFILREVSDPQNSTSLAESLSETTPTPEATNTPTPNPTPTQDPEPTPTQTPSPTPTPTPTEAASPTPTPTQEPEPTPTQTPSPTPTEVVSPTPTVQPTITPTPTQKQTEYRMPNGKLVCVWKRHIINTPIGTFALPFITCEFVRERLF